MASDRQQFDRASRKWNDLHAERIFSAPVRAGRAAIFVTNEGYGEDDNIKEYTYNFMRAEAQAFAENFSDFYADIELHKKISFDNLECAVRDPEVSGIVVVGEGNLSTVFDDNGGENIRWSDISEWSTHLKQGVFFQRFCGNIPEGVPVPLGTFAMSSLSSVWAAVGKTFQPEYDPGIEKEFQPVSSADMLTYEGIVRAFGDPSTLKPATPTGLIPNSETLMRNILSSQ